MELVYSKSNAGDPTWQLSPMKFQAFALTEYTRILAFDSDAQVLRNMDSYFLAPEAPIAVPRAYWLLDDPATSAANITSPQEINQQTLGSHVILATPSKKLYRVVRNEAEATGAFDMEIINKLFRNSAMILPHRGLALLSGEFRRNATDHGRYLAGSGVSRWNATREYERASLVHFSDWPLPKPWEHRKQEDWEAALPACDAADTSTGDDGWREKCPDRAVWTGIYEEYDRDREGTCGIIYDLEK